MSRSIIPAALLTCFLAACSSSNSPVNLQPNDPTDIEPMNPVASQFENGQQFNSPGRPAQLANLLASEITSLLNTLNQAITSGTTGESNEAANCLAGFDASLGTPASGVDCTSAITLNAINAETLSGQMVNSDFCVAALTNQLAQDCALQDGSISLAFEWVVSDTGTPTPLLATTIRYSQTDMKLILDTPEQVGDVASVCSYDMANDGRPLDNVDEAICSQRLAEVVGRFE